MKAPVTIIGSYVSPYVRKVLACLHLKGVEYRIDPVAGFFGDDRFTALSPLRRIPVYIDAQATICDSTVICEYLEERYPSPALLPRDPADRARARWIEEYADTRLADVLIWGLFNEAVIRPGIWGRERNLIEIERIVREEIPGVLDFLETQAPAEGFLFGELGLPDIAVAVGFRNAGFARFRIDVQRWPRAAAWVDRVLGHPCLTPLQAFELLLMRTPVPEHRTALAAAGAPLTEDTYGTSQPRRGPMSR